MNAIVFGSLATAHFEFAILAGIHCPIDIYISTLSSPEVVTTFSRTKRGKIGKLELYKFYKSMVGVT